MRERKRGLFGGGHEGSVAFVEVANAVDFDDLEVLRPGAGAGEGALRLEALEDDAAQGRHVGGGESFTQDAAIHMSSFVAVAKEP